MPKRIYLDNHATTPVDPRVLEAMLPWLGEKFGNASSRQHSFGWEAEQAVEKARGQVAALIGAAASEIVFTSGATESDNLAIKGVAEARAEPGGHLVTMATEHKAVLDPARRLESRGWRVTRLRPRGDGLLDLDELAAVIADDTALVSVMYANNETGVVQPMREIGALCRERGVALHSDAVQAVGKIPVDVERDGIGVLSLSAHKMYGPKGVGALYVRRRGRRVELAPQLDGGGQERGLRAGTLNVPGIVGLGAACELCRLEMEAESARLGALRDKLAAALETGLDGVQVNGSRARRLPHNLNMSFAGVDGEALLMSVPEVALSGGSACASASPEPSHVLRAMGVPDALARAAIRFSLGRFNTEEEIEYAAGRVIAAVRRLRALGPLAPLVEVGRG
jgi:cysteine desulfurase